MDLKRRSRRMFHQLKLHLHSHLYPTVSSSLNFNVIVFVGIELNNRLWILIRALSHRVVIK